MRQGDSLVTIATSRPQRTYASDVRDRARVLLEGGIGREEASRVLGIPLTTLNGWARKYNWTVPSRGAVAYTDATKETALRDVDSGASISFVSRMTGITRKTLYRWLRSRGTGREAPAMRRCPCEGYGTLVPAGAVCPKCQL